MSLLSICLLVVVIPSIAANAVMFWYAKNSLSNFNSVYRASENLSEVFSTIDTYREHLAHVYEMPTFYGDETLKGLLEHTGQMIEFMKRYDEVYSFTQPNLEEQLSAAAEDLKEYDEEKEKEE